MRLPKCASRNRSREADTPLGRITPVADMYRSTDRSRPVPRRQNSVRKSRSTNQFRLVCHYPLLPGRRQRRANQVKQEIRLQALGRKAHGLHSACLRFGDVQGRTPAQSLASAITAPPAPAPAERKWMAQTSRM